MMLRKIILAGAGVLLISACVSGCSKTNEKDQVPAPQAGQQQDSLPELSQNTLYKTNRPPDAAPDYSFLADGGGNQPPAENAPGAPLED